MFLNLNAVDTVIAYVRPLENGVLRVSLRLPVANSKNGARFVPEDTH